MLRVCFIGNSHLACIKQAWDRDKASRYSDITAMFFALPGDGIDRLGVRGNSIGSDEPAILKMLKYTSQGCDRIDMSHDVYVLHGMNLGIGETIARHGSMRKDDETHLMQFVISPELRSAFRDVIENSSAMKLLRKLRSLTQAPVFVSPTPMSNARLPNIRALFEENYLAESIADLFHREVISACEDLRTHYVPQPPQTFAEDGLAVKPEYSVDPARYRSRKADDRCHVNADYGAAVLVAVFDAIAASGLMSQAGDAQSAATSAAL